jgi:hypothetical protein
MINSPIIVDAAFNSLLAALEAEIAELETVFTTNSGTCSMFRSVSFGFPSRSLAGTKSKVGGFAVTHWKKLNGARLARPAGEIVATQAMGRGMIARFNHGYTSRGASVEQSICMAAMVYGPPAPSRSPGAAAGGIRPRRCPVP